MSAHENQGRRNGWFVAALLLLAWFALSGAWGTYRFLETYQDLVSHYDSRFRPHWQFLALAAVAALLTICSLIGMAVVWRLWRRRK